MENQTGVDYDMPLRVIGYDGQSYRSQLLDRKKDESRQRYPVITLVLYFGMEHWKGPRSLSERISVPEVLKPYFNDYKIHVFEIAYLTDKQIKMFKSDFGVIADYFVQKRKSGRYIPSRRKLIHTDEVLKLMAVLTNDNRFLNVQVKQGGEANMCEIIDQYIQQGIELGIEQGMEQGIVQGIGKGMLIGKIQILIEDGYDNMQIATRLCISEEEVEEILKEI